jgi:hypothetical protein
MSFWLIISTVMSMPVAFLNSSVDLDVGGGDEAAPLQIMELARLRVRRSLAAKERRGEKRATGYRGRLDELAPRDGGPGRSWRG